jgi:hypothetical protein
MSQQSTTKSFQYGSAPGKIHLLGDKTQKPEPATHIIEFPGGAVELSRTTDGNYWAHIIVNRDFALPEGAKGLYGAYGEIVGSRIDYDFPTDPHIVDVPNAEQVRQIAILIRPTRAEGTSAPVSLPRVPLPLVDAVAT